MVFLSVPFAILSSIRCLPKFVFRRKWNTCTTASLCNTIHSSCNCATQCYVKHQPVLLLQGLSLWVTCRRRIRPENLVKEIFKQCIWTICTYYDSPCMKLRSPIALYWVIVKGVRNQPSSQRNNALWIFSRLLLGTRNSEKNSEATVVSVEKPISYKPMSLRRLQRFSKVFWNAGNGLRKPKLSFYSQVIQNPHISWFKLLYSFHIVNMQTTCSCMYYEFKSCFYRFDICLA